MDRDDLPPPQQQMESDDTTFSGQLGLTFAGLAWVAIFIAVAGAGLWAVIHWS
jgi:hypothetical protein